MHGEAFGPYRLVRRIGRGAMSMVYQAADGRDREVALKVMLPDIAADGGARARFLQEAKTMVGLQHRNIVTVFDSGLVDDVPYIAMELLAGMTLAARMGSAEPMSLDDKLDVLIQLCEGLQFAHDRGIVHRDVKPSNVWLLPNGGVKLLDFGVAKIEGSALTMHGSVLGSAAYMAPEQLRAEDVDPRADIFSAGAILYELIAGQRPFHADSIAAEINNVLNASVPSLRVVCPDVPEEIVTAVEMALQKDRAARYTQIADLGTDLRLARYDSHNRVSLPLTPTLIATDHTVMVPAIDSADDRSSGSSHDQQLTVASHDAAVREELAAAPTMRSRIEVFNPIPTTEHGSPKTAPPQAVVPPAAKSTPPPHAKSASPSSTKPLPPWPPPKAAPVAPLAKPAPAAATSAKAVQTAASAAPAAPHADRQDVEIPSTVIERWWPLAAAAVVILAAGIALWPTRTVPTATPALYQLAVKSSPTGAAVTLDGVATGKMTPAVLSVEKKPSRIGLTLNGFESVEAGLPGVTNERPANLEFTLRRLLSVRSNPAGAHIIFDGRDTGLITPTQVPVPNPAPGYLDLQGPRGLRRRAAITADALDRGELFVSMIGSDSKVPILTEHIPDEVPLLNPTPIEGPPPVLKTEVVSVHLTGAYPFEVAGCGKKSAAATDHDIEVAAPCTLRLRSAEYFLDSTRSIEAASGRVEIAAPQLARVQLRSRFEWCTVIVGGRAVGSPPIGLELAAGSYTATIQCPEKSYKTRAFSVDPGASIRRLDDYLIP